MGKLGCSYLCQGRRIADSQKGQAERIRLLRFDATSGQSRSAWWTSRAMKLFKQRMISRLLSPSAVRLAAYAWLRGSRLRRFSATTWRARLASRLPWGLKRYLTTLPGEAGMGATPHRLAKVASLFSSSGLSPATTRSGAAVSGPTPSSATSRGDDSLTRHSIYSWSSVTSSRRPR